MTKAEFITECNIRLLEPLIVLEDESIKRALYNRDDKKVIKLLDNNF
tara:strand:- start:115 stop:255 length:141 start_codon:yes stop_codon:yes gene_type:complete